jgi:hypothetical protein
VELIRTGAWRRWAAVGTAILAAVVVWTWLRADGSSGSPEGVARAFILATREGDRQAVWDHLGPASRERLEKAAWDATQKVGGARRFTALDVLDVGTSATSYLPTGVVLRESKDDHATVDILGPDGRRDELRLVRVTGSWKVELDWGSAQN